MSDAGRILIVDDDDSIRAMLLEYLGDHGFLVRAAGTGQAMRAEIERDLPDLILLDVRLPGEDGLSLARFLRERYDVGIIMVTASDATVDRVVGLEIGADDYVAKPFDPRELLARIKSLLRRMQARPPADNPAHDTTSARAEAAADAGGGAGTAGSRNGGGASGTVAGTPANGSPARTPEIARRVHFGRCMLDLDARRLFDSNGQDVPMTAMEYELLCVLLANPNRVLSRDQLLNQTRNRDWEPFDRSIDIRVGRLRRKVEHDPDRPRAIRTVRNAGYMYVPEPDHR